MTQYITDSREKVQTQALWNDIKGLQSFWMLFRSLERILTKGQFGWILCNTDQYIVDKYDL